MTWGVRWTDALRALVQADLDAGQQDADIARNHDLTIRQIYNGVANGVLIREKKKTGPKGPWRAPKVVEIKENAVPDVATCPLKLVG